MLYRLFSSALNDMVNGGVDENENKGNNAQLIKSSASLSRIVFLRGLQVVTCALFFSTCAVLSLLSMNCISSGFDSYVDKNFCNCCIVGT